MAGALMVAAAFLMKVLKNVSKVVWGELWEELYKLIIEAQKQWGRGYGEEKAAWVKAKALEWLKTKTKISWFQQIVASFLLQQILNAFVSELNEHLGNDWLEHAEKAKDELEKRVPFLNWAIGAGGLS